MKHVVMIVYANDTTLRGFCLTILANNYISLSEGKWNEMKKLNSEGRRIPNENLSSEVSRIQFYGVSTVQEKQQLEKQQSGSKVL